MKKYLALMLLATPLFFGCGATGKGEASAPVAASVGGNANAFNPYMNSKLPNVRQISDENQRMLGSMGAKNQSIEGEAAHRKNWREEIYPVVFGDRNAPNEVIVLLDFANPDSEKIWQQVVDSTKSLQASQCKVVVLARSGENYGTDLMGLAIWIAHSRPGQAMPYISYALKRWNEVKAAQKAAGKMRSFTNEYDATATSTDLPIHYAWFPRLNPPIPASQQTEVARYCYNAGNVNMYQANQICQYYGVKKLPAIIVNGKVLGNMTASAILAALK